jgi:hypothetical protein
MSKKIYDKSRILDDTWGLQVVDPDKGDPSVLKPLSEIIGAGGLTASNARITDIETALKIPEDTPTVPVASTETLIMGAQPSDDDTVTIGSTVYTFKTELSADPTVAYEVLIGASANDASTNLISAINLTGTIGTDYGTGTLINPDVTAVISTDDVVITAKVKGTVGNAIALDSSFTSGSNLWTASATAMSGGVDGDVYEAGQVLRDEDYIYLAIDDTTTASDANIRKILLPIDPITVTTATATIDTNAEIILVDYSATGACAVTLDDTAMLPHVLNIKDSGLLSGTNTITIDTTGSGTIDGDASVAITANGDNLQLYFDGTNFHIL